MKVKIAVASMLLLGCIATPMLIQSEQKPSKEKAMREYYSTHQTCECCHDKNLLRMKNEVHHIKPQHLYPELANDTNNFIVLCRWCHFHIGHQGSFKNENTNLLNDISNLQVIIKETVK